MQIEEKITHPSYLIRPYDFNHMIFDRSRFNVNITCYDDHPGFANAYEECRKKDGLVLLDKRRVWMVRGGLSKKGKKRIYHFIISYDSLNGNEIGRFILKSNYGINLNSFTDTCGKLNFIPVHIRMDKSIPLARILSKEVPEELFSRLDGFAKSAQQALLAKFPGAHLYVRPFTIASLEINLDTITAVGVDFATSRDVAINLSSLVTQTNTGYYLDFHGHKIPVGNPPILRSLVKSQKILGVPALRGKLIPDFRAYLYDDAELVIYLKEWSATGYHLQRIEYRMHSKEKVAGAVGRKTFGTALELQVLLNDLYTYVWDQLSPALMTEFRYLSDGELRRAEIMIRGFHPKNADLLVRALLYPPYKVSTTAWFANARLIRKATEDGLLIKVGPYTKSNDYIISREKLQSFQIPSNIGPEWLKHDSHLLVNREPHQPSISSGAESL